MMELLHSLLFASDAEILALWGAGFLLLAGLATFMERRRSKRARIEKVGWVPWTGIFLGSALIGCGLLAMSLPVVFGNS